MQLKTQLWVQALAKRANQAGSHSAIERIGDKERGDVLVKVVDGAGGASVYGQAFDPEGRGAFRRLPEGAPATTEAAAATYMAQRIEYDPDLWVVEIFDRRGRHFLTERVLPDIDPFG